MEGDAPEGTRLKANAWQDIDDASGWDESWEDDEGGVLLFEPDSAPDKGAPSALSLELGMDGQVPAKPQRAIYAAHALARWAWRTWEFAVVLILMHLHPKSLLMVSLYGLLENMLRLLLGSAVGRFVDRAERLRGGCAMYALQNGLIVTSAAAAGTLMLWETFVSRPLDSKVYWALLGTTIGCGALSSVASLGVTVSVEREWCKALCGLDHQALARMNSAMRAIDLTCQILAPMVSGLLMQFAGMPMAIAVIAGYSQLVFVPEMLLLRVAVQASPSLSEAKVFGSSAVPDAPLKALWSGWRTYFSQSTLLAGLALAQLYLTVLSLGSLMTGFAKHSGLTEVALSGFRAAGAVSGLAAPALFPPLNKRLGLKAAGALGISWQLMMLTGGTLPLVLQRLGVLFGDVETSVLLYALLGGVVASRMGLWLVDLAVGQLQQEYVDPQDIGVVGAVQASVSSLFEVATFVAASIMHQSERFHLLMLGSLASVASAWAMLMVYALRPQRRYQLIQETTEEM